MARRSCGAVHENLVRECGRAHYRDSLKPWREHSRAYRATFLRGRTIFFVGSARNDL